MTEAELLESFENATLTPAEFTHRTHVRVAWALLSQESPAAALLRLEAGLQRFATTHGAADHYHRTITWAYALLIQERLETGETWAEFEQRHPELFDRQPSILDHFYSAAVLESAKARQRFVFPDRCNGIQ